MNDTNGELYPWEDVDASRQDEKLQRSQDDPPSETDEVEITTISRGSGDGRSPRECARESFKETKCPSCGRRIDELALFYFCSPASTWEHLCGRAGWMVVCDPCHRQVAFGLETMN